jgi:hypothetical protein
VYTAHTLIVNNEFDDELSPHQFVSWITVLFATAVLLSGPVWALHAGDSVPLVALPTSAADALFRNETSAGKLVYVDVWASRCQSCTQSFPGDE